MEMHEETIGVKKKQLPTIGYSMDDSLTKVVNIVQSKNKRSSVYVMNELNFVKTIYLL